MPKKNPWHELIRILEKASSHLEAEEKVFLGALCFFLLNLIDQLKEDDVTTAWTEAVDQIAGTMERGKK